MRDLAAHKTVKSPPSVHGALNMLMRDEMLVKGVWRMARDDGREARTRAKVDRGFFSKSFCDAVAQINVLQHVCFKQSI